MASFSAQFLIAQLRQRGELAAAHVVQRNHAAFDSLSDADRRRVEGLAYAVAARLLEGPVSRLERLGHGADGPTVEAVRDLFGLDAGGTGRALPGVDVSTGRRSERPGSRQPGSWAKPSSS